MIISVYRKNDKLLRVQVKDDIGTPVNLDGASLLFVVKSAAEELIRKEIGAGITIIDAEEGQIEVDIDATDTDHWPGTYRYELLLTDCGGNRYTALKNLFVIMPSITANKE
jgi:hypothetical protein